ncbi:hypothetical protein DENSPDRAFT_215747 [Dentipellis sp. KUC8613]|nr:hypothetical protein DENSPDRAFT_215747 [Dentipellis sp. KUC8613]
MNDYTIQNSASEDVNMSSGHSFCIAGDANGEEIIMSTGNSTSIAGDELSSNPTVIYSDMHSQPRDQPFVFNAPPSRTSRTGFKLLKPRPPPPIIPQKRKSRPARFHAKNIHPLNERPEKIPRWGDGPDVLTLAEPTRPEPEVHTASPDYNNAGIAQDRETGSVSSSSSAAEILSMLVPDGAESSDVTSGEQLDEDSEIVEAMLMESVESLSAPSPSAAPGPPQLASRSPSPLGATNLASDGRRDALPDLLCPPKPDNPRASESPINSRPPSEGALSSDLALPNIEPSRESSPDLRDLHEEPTRYENTGSTTSNPAHGVQKEAHGPIDHSPRSSLSAGADEEQPMHLQSVNAPTSLDEASGIMDCNNMTPSTSSAPLNPAPASSSEDVLAPLAQSCLDAHDGIDLRPLRSSSTTATETPAGVGTRPRAETSDEKVADIVMEEPRGEVPDTTTTPSNSAQPTSVHGVIDHEVQSQDEPTGGNNDFHIGRFSLRATKERKKSAAKVQQLPQARKKRAVQKKTGTSNARATRNKRRNVLPAVPAMVSQPVAEPPADEDLPMGDASAQATSMSGGNTDSSSQVGGFINAMAEDLTDRLSQGASESAHASDAPSLPSHPENTGVDTVAGRDDASHAVHVNSVSPSAAVAEPPAPRLSTDCGAAEPLTDSLPTSPLGGVSLNATDEGISLASPTSGVGHSSMESGPAPSTPTAAPDLPTMPGSFDGQPVGGDMRMNVDVDESSLRGNAAEPPAPEATTDCGTTEPLTDSQPTSLPGGANLNATDKGIPLASPTSGVGHSSMESGPAPSTPTAAPDLPTMPGSFDGQPVGGGTRMNIDADKLSHHRNFSPASPSATATEPPASHPTTDCGNTGQLPDSELTPAFSGASPNTTNEPTLLASPASGIGHPSKESETGPFAPDHSKTRASLDSQPLDDELGMNVDVDESSRSENFSLASSCAAVAKPPAPQPTTNCGTTGPLPDLRSTPPSGVATLNATDKCTPSADQAAGISNLPPDSGRASPPASTPHVSVDAQGPPKASSAASNARRPYEVLVEDTSDEDGPDLRQRAHLPADHRYIIVESASLSGTEVDQRATGRRHPSPRARSKGKQDTVQSAGSTSESPRSNPGSQQPDLDPADSRETPQDEDVEMSYAGDTAAGKTGRPSHEGTPSPSPPVVGPSSRPSGPPPNAGGAPPVNPSHAGDDSIRSEKKNLRQDITAKRAKLFTGFENLPTTLMSDPSRRTLSITTSPSQ